MCMFASPSLQLPSNMFNWHPTILLSADMISCKLIYPAAACLLAVQYAPSGLSHFGPLHVQCVLSSAHPVCFTTNPFVCLAASLYHPSQCHLVWRAFSSPIYQLIPTMVPPAGLSHLSNEQPISHAPSLAPAWPIYPATSPSILPQSVWEPDWPICQATTPPVLPYATLSVPLSARLSSMNLLTSCQPIHVSRSQLDCPATHLAAASVSVTLPDMRLETNRWVAPAKTFCLLPSSLLALLSVFQSVYSPGPSALLPSKPFILLALLSIFL